MDSKKNSPQNPKASPSKPYLGHEEICRFRKELDQIDDQLLKLLTERYNKVLEVQTFKKAHQKPEYDPQREKEILDRLTVDLTPAKKTYVTEIFKALFSIGLKSVQKELKDDA